MKIFTVNAMSGYPLPSNSPRVIDVFEVLRVQPAARRRVQGDFARLEADSGWAINPVTSAAVQLKHTVAPTTVHVPLSLRERSP